MLPSVIVHAPGCVGHLIVPGGHIDNRISLDNLRTNNNRFYYLHKLSERCRPWRWVALRHLIFSSPLPLKRAGFTAQMDLTSETRDDKGRNAPCTAYSARRSFTASLSFLRLVFWMLPGPGTR